MKKREWLIAYRKEKKYKQKEMANEIDVSQSTYSAYEMGDRTPKPATAKKIAKVLKFDWTKFYE